MAGIYPTLDKNYILQRISQEDIFSKFLDISLSDIDHCIRNSGYLIKAPYTIRTTDDTPSCGFRYAGHKLRFKDFAGYFWGDCFDAVAFVHNIDVNDSRGFMEVLDLVAKSFRIHKYEGTDVVVPTNRHLDKTPISKKPPIEIKIKKRPFNRLDATYWSKIFFTKGDLIEAEIYACQYIWLNGFLAYDYDKINSQDVAYAYYFGVDKASGLDIIKIYFPYRSKKQGRFIMNIPVIEGLRKQKIAEILVLTKSYKDVVALRKLCKGRFDVDALGLPSENHIISKDDYYNFWLQYNQIVTLMDFDFTGRSIAWKHRTIYNIPSLFLTNGKLNTTNYGSKDFTDYLAHNGQEQTIKLIENAYKYVTNKYRRKEI
jgi:hypothetical protein